MITETDLQSAIAECHGERNPDAKTCMKLAAFYTIQDHLYGKPDISGVSFAAPPENPPSEGITYQSGTDFSRAVYGKDVEKVLEVVDDLMSTLWVRDLRLYKKALRKFEEV